jgi:predicted AlkP superfamily pyrophosphatase or phosphodiesterase
MLVLVASAATAGAADRRTDHVVLISVDGLRPEFYLEENWPAPMLQQMRREGAHARAVKSVFPSVTYPAHTTIITGRMPIDHGLSYNGPFEPRGQTGRWYWEEEHILVPTLWDAARAAGLKTASIFWPVSVGAPVDWNVPEVWPLDWEVDEFTDPMRRLSTPAGLVEELEREATGRLSSTNFSFGRMNLDDKSSEMAAYLLATYKPNLLTLHLLAVDGVQHDEGRDSSSLPRALATLDRGVARLVEAAEQADILDRTTFLVTGDHGFINLHTEVAPNVWMVAAGLMAARADRGDWQAAVHNTSVAGFLFLADPEDQESLNKAREVLDAQPAEVRSLFKVLERADLDRLQSAPDAALGLTPVPGAYISSRYEPPAVRPIDGASHGYLPDIPEMYTGFVAWGAGIRPGASIPMMGLEQIAPLVSSLLGLGLEEAEGQTPEGMLGSD